MGLMHDMVRAILNFCSGTSVLFQREERRMVKFVVHTEPLGPRTPMCKVTPLSDDVCNGNENTLHPKLEGCADGEVVPIEQCPCCKSTTAAEEINRRAFIYAIDGSRAAEYECNVARMISRLLNELCDAQIVHFHSDNERSMWLTHGGCSEWVHLMLSDLIGYDGLAQLVITLRSLLFWKTGAGQEQVKRERYPPHFSRVAVVIAVCVSIAHKCVDDDRDISAHLIKLFGIDRTSFTLNELSIVSILVRFTPFALSTQSMEHVMAQMGYTEFPGDAAAAVDVS